jgi:hypothetical protein
MLAECLRSLGKCPGIAPFPKGAGYRIPFHEESAVNLRSGSPLFGECWFWRVTVVAGSCGPLPGLNAAPLAQSALFFP